MINNNELISIVVPIYNVEKYLDRCVRSLVTQTYTNLQIILVDDGSPDNCPSICDKWAKLDDRIVVIHKKNSGLGFTRNAGLNLAKGKYVCFVDSDDYIHETTIEKLVRRSEEKSADACYYGCVDVLDGVLCEKEPPQKLFYQKEEIRTEFAIRLIGNLPHEDNKNFTGLSACYAFYQTEFLKKNNIVFHSEKEKYISEDLIFNLTVCKYADRLSILPESLYYYVLRKSDSLRSTYREDRFEKSKLMYYKLLESCEDFGLEKDGILRAQKYLLQAAIVCVKMELLTNKNKKEVIGALKSFTQDELIQEILKHYPIKKLPFRQRIFMLFLKYHFVGGLYLIAYFQNKKTKFVV